MALAVECAELMEHFQWLTESQSRRLGRRQLREVEMELADIQIYLIRLSQVLELDLVVAGNRKLLENARKYPVDKARGSAKKYTELRKKGRTADRACARIPPTVVTINGDVASRVKISRDEPMRRLSD